MEPAAVTAGHPPPPAAPGLGPACGTAAGWAWPGGPALALGPELDPVVDALIASWRSAQAAARPEPAAHSPPEPVLEVGL